MREIFLNSSINFISKNNPEYDEIDLSTIKYGLESLYIIVTKVGFVLILSLFLGILQEMLVLLIIYNIVKLPSFGLHATKSSICLTISTISFLASVYVGIIVKLNIYYKLAIGIYFIFMLFKNAPADTHKRPIVNKKRRLIYKILTTVIAIAYVITSVLIKNNTISNFFLISLGLQVITTSPFIYKVFNLPYDNFKKYNKG